MANRFSSGKHAIAACDRCGFRFKLKSLKELVIKTKRVNLLVCSSCWDDDHPQLRLGMYPIADPQAVRNPRPDRQYDASGTTVDGDAGSGSRTFAWGWNPVGGSLLSNTPNPLAIQVQLGTIEAVTT